MVRVNVGRRAVLALSNHGEKEKGDMVEEKTARDYWPVIACQGAARRQKGAPPSEKKGPLL